MHHHKIITSQVSGIINVTKSICHLCFPIKFCCSAFWTIYFPCLQGSYHIHYSLLYFFISFYSISIYFKSEVPILKVSPKLCLKRRMVTKVSNLPMVMFSESSSSIDMDNVILGFLLITGKKNYTYDMGTFWALLTVVLVQ